MSTSPTLNLDIESRLFDICSPLHFNKRLFPWKRQHHRGRYYMISAVIPICDTASTTDRFDNITFRH
ncbi:uncharacterized protein YALI1_F35894g [Yarrowia lipolytica]|uniref:Uncharacterized protein n=1 Tax=Yarrowia lipolytica TaxID=4952 RepID=A0A1D8NQB7_YARLL|nr:hypothetical protein YALI1_F35894g [Yarrowia lipolytica]